MDEFVHFISKVVSTQNALGVTKYKYRLIENVKIVIIFIGIYWLNNEHI